MASTLSLDVRYIFLVGSRMFLSMVVQQLAVILVLWLEKVNTSPSTSLLYSDSSICSAILLKKYRKVEVLGNHTLHIEENCNNQFFFF